MATDYLFNCPCRNLQGICPFIFQLNTNPFFLPLKVVAQLKSTCESLSEEQLAKLGVMLFNCQAQVEGRPTYSCTEEMVYPLFQIPKRHERYRNP